MLPPHRNPDDPAEHSPGEQGVGHAWHDPIDPYAPPTQAAMSAAELPDWFKLMSGCVILVSLAAVTSQAFVGLTGYLLPPYLLFLTHPLWQAVAILLVPILVVYRVVRRRQRTWKIDIRSSGWANFFLWWGVFYYLALGLQLLIRHRVW